MGIVAPRGSIEVSVSDKIAVYTRGSDTKIYYRTVDYGTTPPRWQYQQDITASTDTQLTPGSSYDKVRIDAGPLENVYYTTGANPVNDEAYLDGVTAGTVTASKVAVCDSNKDLGDFRNLDCTNLDAGASGTAGSVDVFPTTASKGKASLTCSDQDGDTAVTVNVLGMGQATTVNIPDPGAATSYLVQSTQANDNDPIDATNAEINRVCDKSTSVVTVTDDTAMTLAAHGERILIVNDAAGAAITLPAATATGNKYTVIIGTSITSNSTTIKAASASDSFFGFAYGVDTDAEGASGYTWNADSGDDTVTLDGGATGGIKGDYWYFTDFASGEWLVEGHITQSGGSEATPFSATVS